MRKNSRLFCFLCKSVCGCPHGGGAATDRGGPDRGAPDAPARSRGPIAGPDRAGPDRAGSNAPAGILWYLFEAAIYLIYILALKNGFYASESQYKIRITLIYLIYFY